MNTRRIIGLFGLLALVLGCTTPAAVAKGKRKAPPRQDDQLLRAMADELDRSVQKLRLGNLDKPYFIEYFAWDTRSLEVEATFGAIVRSEQRRSRPSRIDVRVGSYERDNTGFIGQESFRSLFHGMGRIMLADDNYTALRHDLWLETDVAYKQALEQLAAKRAYLKNKVQTENLDDFLRVKPVQALASRNRAALEAGPWEDRVRRLSAVFRRFPHIQDSSVRLVADAITKYVVNSEGSRIRQPETVVRLTAHASAQAEDGMPLKHHVAFYATGLDRLPAEKELEAAIAKMAEELTALRDAPVAENFSGPVLVTGEAAGSLLQQVLVPNLVARRQPLIGIPQMARMAGQAKENRLKRRLLPLSFSVLDDPTRDEAGGRPLIGSVRYDDEGVPARAVELVKKGKVVGLLSTRTPIKDASEPNGHARRGMPGFNSAQITNLIVTTTKGQPFDRLKQRLIEALEEQNVPHGLIIRRLDDPDITGRDFNMQTLMAAAMGQGQTVHPPTLAYRVSRDGKEELVRGLGFEDLSASQLRDIVAAGSDASVFHQLTSDGMGAGGALSFLSMMGGRGPTMPTTPTSVVAPSLLFEELELKRLEGSLKKPVFLPHPYFDK